jgi:NADH-quinone oxidoreductase subunit M
MAVYKLIHNIFLGQLRTEHEEIHEVPWSMLVPMLAFGVVIFLTGMVPGLVLEWVAAVQKALGMKPVAWTLGGLNYDNGNGLDMIWIVGILLAGVAVAAVIFYGFGNRAKRVHQLDNYAGGHFLDASTRYQYSDHFYAGFTHLVGSWYRDSFRWAESAVAAAVETLSLWSHRLSLQKVQALAMTVMAAILLAWVVY